MRNGKDKGKKGKIIEVFRKQNRVIVDGINVRHSKKKSIYLII
jgi:ribosomal protein L24